MTLDDFEKTIKKDKAIVVVKTDKDKILCRPKTGGMYKRIIKIPKVIDPDTAFIAGFLIGDGYLPKEGFRIAVDIVSKNLLEILSSKFKKVFDLDLRLKRIIDRRPGRQPRWKIDFMSKPIWLLFTLVFDIPFGRKCERVIVPPIITDFECKKMFLSGLFLADGGRKGKRLSFTTISEKLFIGLQGLLKEFEVGFFTRTWIYPKYKRRVFDIVICKKSDINKFRDTFPLIEEKLAGVA